MASQQVPRLFTFKNSLQAYVEDESTSMGTASAYAAACTPTPQCRRRPSLDTSCPLNDSQAPIHATPDPRPRHVRCTINAPPYDCVLAALVTRLGLRCGYEPVWLHLPSSFTPSLASPAFAHPSLLPFLTLRAIFSPNPSISALARSSFPLPPRPAPPLHASPTRNRTLVLLDPLR
ncbi:hypothetical protein DFH08DRAFT_242784 [Mycena albidolilacea]|uniref:Uncharacterized protein n=1 Tax=Mycena albidolilacea TaxID=1033008 RepID=A0AAD6ZUM6_9AGAR|nr:hypothetical protein DFH08DRAFT_242784 [Mycena albidolilacea]